MAPIIFKPTLPPDCNDDEMSFYSGSRRKVMFTRNIGVKCSARISSCSGLMQIYKVHTEAPFTAPLLLCTTRWFLSAVCSSSLVLNRFQFCLLSSNLTSLLPSLWPSFSLCFATVIISEGRRCLAALLSTVVSDLGR